MAENVNRAVIDANLAIALVIPLPYSVQAVSLWESQMMADIYVPALWEYEIVSALRKIVAMGQLETIEAEHALDRLLMLAVHRIAPEVSLHKEALKWAERLGQANAYDAQDLAVAARLGAPLYTADQQLARKAHALGVDWVRWVGQEAVP